jgi:adenylate kinase
VGVKLRVRKCIIVGMGAKKVFITGIPTSGKSYVAKRVAETLGGIHVPIDDIQGKIASNPQFEPWVNFYFNKDEEKYYTETTPEERWGNLVRQSEGLWPAILLKVEEYEKNSVPIIIEGVNLLPNLVYRDLRIPGIVLAVESFEDVLERNKRDPRWGKTEALQKLEAEEFFYSQQPHYIQEAEKYGYNVFKNNDEAEKEIIHLVS